MPHVYTQKTKQKIDGTPDARAAVNACPPKYSVDYPRQAQKLCTMGATLADLAEFFKVTVKTIQTWAYNFPEFERAIRVGKDPADERVVMSLYQKAIGYDYTTTQDVLDKDGGIVTLRKTQHVPPDTTAITYWLKNRRRTEWRDRHEIEVGMVGEFERMSDAELIGFIEGTIVEEGAGLQAISYERHEEEVPE